MKKYSLFLVPLLFGVWFGGCDNNCCGPVTEKKSDPKPTDQNPPVAQINLAGALNGECTPGETVTLTPASTDSDGTVTENIWKVNGVVVANTTVICPDAGENKTICLTAVDNDGLESEEVCTTIRGKAEAEPTTTPPVSIITKGTTFADGQEFDCSTVHDTDNIHTYPNETYLYGSNTPKDIKEVTWDYTYYLADGTIESGPNTKTQKDYNIAENKPAGSCTKWFHTNNGVTRIEFKITTLDDDHETNSTEYTFDVATKTLTQK